MDAGEVTPMGRASKREQLAEAAFRQFHERGFNATAVGDITAAADVPKGSFYNHFPSKESSALEALRRYAATLRFELLSECDAPPLQRLRAHFEFLGQDTVEGGFVRGCLVGNFGAEVADHSEEIRQAVRSGFDTWATEIERVLLEAQEAGDLDRALDVKGTATFILSAWEGTLIVARADKSAAPVDAFFRTVFDVLLRPLPAGPDPI
ncbi:TetR/AcrR family transcriptional regulator [Streptomyces sp. NBC_00687]|uniref:TetR/AcrR family transcriptional regulator n=1 Tax=Streptomyces sp. NBC_00687 TaxID=2975807 RepID=UPI0022521369|nr:TetR/AcrR family transcriptional regulator [Streptomyces sp. NBC_00687]MCX4919091.1 TetR/AcrR family transcriptional regulator [Streptomyces sp. NBC_00687]